MSVRLSACVSAAPTGRIYVKFDIGDFRENVAKISGVSSEDPCRCCRNDIVTYLLTYSMVQSHSWEANWFSASQEIPRILWNPKAHYLSLLPNQLPETVKRLPTHDIIKTSGCSSPCRFLKKCSPLPIVENGVSTDGSDTHDPRRSRRKTYTAKIEKLRHTLTL